MVETENRGAGLSLKLFVGFLVVATAALSVMVVLLTRENEALKSAVEKLEAKATRGGLIPGDLVETIELRDGKGAPHALEFGPDAPVTLLFLTSVGCGACDETIPVWEGVLTEAQPDGVRVVCVLAGTRDAAELAEDGSEMWECYAAPKGREGWLRQIPTAPSAVLFSGDGRVLHRWFGHMSASQAEQMKMALIDLSGG